MGRPFHAAYCVAVRNVTLLWKKENQNFLICKADNGHFVPATSVKLIVIYSGCIAKSSWTPIDNICMLNGLLSLIFIEKSTSACEA